MYVSSFAQVEDDPPESTHPRHSHFETAATLFFSVLSISYPNAAVFDVYASLFSGTPPLARNLWLSNLIL
jgi:hypothetical protein